MIHIVTCAYKTAEYAEKHVQAILSQRGDFHHWVAVDGCESTLEAYKGLKHSKMTLYYSEKNIGKSLLQNSLVDKLPNDATLLLFDSDDFMALDTIKNLPNPSKFIYSLPFNNNGEKKKGFAQGVLLMKKKTYYDLGGFDKQFIVGADTDLIRRYEAINSRQIYLLKDLKPFYRTVRNDSLSHCKEMAVGTEFRNRERALIEERIKKRIFKIPYEKRAITQIV